MVKIKEIIEREIEEVLADVSDNRLGSIWRRECAQQNRVLRVIVTIGGIYALTPTGDVVLFDEDNPNIPQPQSGHIVNVIRYRVSQRYPDLASLAPTRGVDAKVCSTCQGSGKRQPPYAYVPCDCGGLVRWRCCR